MNEVVDPIVIRRGGDESATDAAKVAAGLAGTTLSGNMRWYGSSGPAFREIGTADHRTIRVIEPDSLDNRAIHRG